MRVISFEFFWHILQLLSCDSYASYIRSAIAMARCLFVAKFCRFSIETAEYRLSWISTQSCAHIRIRISPELREITYGIVPNSDFSWFSFPSSRHVNRRKCCQGMFNVRWNMMDSYTLVYARAYRERNDTVRDRLIGCVSEVAKWCDCSWTFVDFFLSRSFSIWLTFVMHLSPKV